MPTRRRLIGTPKKDSGSNESFEPESFFGVPMSLRRVGMVTAIALATMLEISCGEVYRPVVIPIAITPPNSANFHAVFAVSTDAQANPGAALQIDVSGDTNIGQANMGINPTHAAILPNNSRIFVASAGSLFQGDTDVVTAFSPAGAGSIATGLGTLTTFSLPNIAGPFICSYLPYFVASSQNNSVYVANYGVENKQTCNFASN